MKEKKVNKWALRGRILWLYTKYQIISKLMIGLVVLPLFGLLSNYLIQSTGRTNISSGDFTSFLLSYQGITLLLVGLIVIVIIMGMDINAFIVMSSLIYEGKHNMKAKDVLIIGIKSIKYFFTPAGLLLAGYIAIVLPLVGMGISIGPFKNFQIPNFITSVIFNTPLYLGIYTIAILALTVISIVYIFTLHYVVIMQNNIRDALKNSRLLMMKHWKSFIKDYILSVIKLFFISVLLIVIILLMLLIIGSLFKMTSIYRNTWSIFSLLTVSELMTYILFIAIPILVSIITKLFYKYNEKDGFDIRLSFKNKAVVLTDEEKTNKIRVKTKLQVGIFILCLMLFNGLISYICAVNFKDLFRQPIRVDIIAHRAGGDLAAENTVEGVNKAISEGAKWVEIDVQRTRDGRYIINHDPTFDRVAGVNKKSKDMTFEEIKKLRVKNLFDNSKPSMPVASLDDILLASKDKIGVFVELKGETADNKMADDVVKIIKKYNMQNQTVLLSLDYPMIRYIVEKYPNMKTGYLYYFTTGNVGDLKGDYLIMEEREATPEKIEEVHKANKKAIVWTVNTEESIDKFIHSEADGVITDYVKSVKDRIKKSNNRTDFEVLVDTVLSD